MKVLGNGGVGMTCFWYALSAWKKWQADKLSRYNRLLSLTRS